MKTGAALCAKEIKKLLKEKYPGINFQVKSKNFSMGNSVDVYWNFGPTQEEIDNLISDYRAGSFNSMDDLYTYNKREDDTPRAKYVHANREFKTQEEIDNYKLKWSDPKHRDLYKEEKTFYHQLTRDLCALFGLETMRPDQQAPEDYKVMARGGRCYVCWSDIIHSLLADTPLMQGYNGVRLKKTENGQEIRNVAEVY